MIALALDLGSKRIGVAASDATGTLAFPICVVERGQKTSAEYGEIAKLATEYAADVLVVGIPVSMNGEYGSQARLYQDEAEIIASHLGLPLETVDERLTTVTAYNQLQSVGKGSKASRRLIDAAAATVTLQSWLDSKRSGPLSGS